jgi:hypothetical protein
MARKITWDKTFTLPDETRICCGSQTTSYGFRHLAVVRRGFYELGKAKVCYYNRTWERYKYQTVARAAIDKAFPADQAKIYRDQIDGKSAADTNAHLGLIAGIAKLGDILTGTPEESNAWKQRMLTAGLGDQGLDIPADFGALPETEKARRLNGAINALTEVKL